ncbi:hypothetical protein P171DRAFT_443109 [Karstenula rhodostoma CBS 690.94]|uniref:Secreted protein n=1 Tax=Karstenula rhodostoma CBS 690.94 TaxID=1392251 RepID=A0A9P4UDR9_9PLEO|nr:hypothetical protein P171DRAFT_443109 [Karstenula rhodostoma CBS 690.94]
MFAIVLLAALIHVSAAAPTQTSPTRDSWPAWVCSDPSFHGYCDRVYADRKCATLPEQLYGKVSSMMQWTGYMCDFYSDDNCEWQHEKLHGDYHGEQTNGVAIKWYEDMGVFNDKMKSVYCIAYVDMHGTASPSMEVPSPDGQRLDTLDAALIQAPGAVTVFTEPKFAGVGLPVTALEECSPTSNAGLIKSLKQQQGAVCHYYQSPGCAISNHVPALRHDSTATQWDAADLGEWAGKIESFICELVAA